MKFISRPKPGSIMHLSVLCASHLSALILTAFSLTSQAQTEQILFDDFSYSSTTQLTNNGWNVRSWSGGPGLENGNWSASNVVFVADPASSSNKFMRLKASTNVNGNNISNNSATTGTTSQAEVSRKELIYKNGTWAARMYFNDAPSTGPDGDSVVETFFGITPYVELREPYSEIDFEYLANGGWWTGSATPSMWSGTYRIVDWSDESNHGVTRTPGSLQGWHTLVMQVRDGHVSFYIDGSYQTEFNGSVAPDYPMYLMFQLWFSDDCFDGTCTQKGYLKNSSYREYFEDIDWVYFEKNSQLSTTDVVQKVASLRTSGISYKQNLDGNNTSSVTSSTPASSSRSSSSLPQSSSSAPSTTGQQCNWWGTYYAICTHISSGWGWQNNADCIGIETCKTLSPPYGVVGGTTSSTPVASSSSSRSSVTVSSSPSSAVVSSSRSSSSLSTSFSLLIQAESYSYMSGIQTEATTDTGGGLNVGWIDATDWLSYANITIPTTGSYKVEYRVASPSGSQLALDLNGGQTSLGTLNIPATGGWQNWTTISHSVQIPAGTHSIGLYAPKSGWNINWFRITKL